MRIHKKGLEGTAIPETSPSEINQVQNSISEGQLKEFISLRRRFRRIYGTGLISLESSDGVHLREDAFLATFPEYETNVRKCDTYPEELSATFDGVRFFCIR